MSGGCQYPFQLLSLQRLSVLLRITQPSLLVLCLARCWLLNCSHVPVPLNRLAYRSLLNYSSNMAVVVAQLVENRNPWFEWRYQQNFLYQLYNRKDKNKEKKAGNGQSLTNYSSNIAGKERSKEESLAEKWTARSRVRASREMSPFSNCVKVDFSCHVPILAGCEH